MFKRKYYYFYDQLNDLPEDVDSFEFEGITHIRLKNHDLHVIFVISLELAMAGLFYLYVKKIDISSNLILWPIYVLALVKLHELIEYLYIIWYFYASKKKS